MVTIRYKMYRGKKMLKENNIEYIENRCTKIEYQKIFLNINPVFPVLQN